MEIEIVGLDSSIINAMRRILLSEIATIAIEDIYVFENTSILNDNILAHRIGLIPLRINPKQIQFQKMYCLKDQTNSVVLILKNSNFCNSFRLTKDIFCKDFSYRRYGSLIPHQSRVYFSIKQDIVKKNSFLTFEDILITKLKPKQLLFLEAHCKKGYSTQHSKYSPVAAAWYLYYSTTILIKNLIYYKQNLENFLYLKKTNINKKFSKFYNTKHLLNGTKLRNSGLLQNNCFNENYVNIKRKNHFLFCLESVGSLRPEYLFLESLFTLSKKFERLKTLI
mmetsp:Transcript_6165/g.7542  ORF Transcript_6165/g.7542 Transcript_6165/m.7542 type:complete len:280 (-) Transcript_6165:338-1177(-)